MKKTLRNNTVTWALIFAFTLAFVDSTARADNLTGVSYNSVTIENVDIFYREAGDPTKPTLLLLHGFPTSSHMFRELISELADEFHLVAPDYPGYGFSAMPISKALTTTSGNRFASTGRIAARSIVPALAEVPADTSATDLDRLGKKR